MKSLIRTGLWERIQLYVIVTMITVLIWLYAESENVKQQEPLGFNIHFVSMSGQRLVIDRPALEPVRIIVRCATGQYAQLRELLSQPLELSVSQEQAVRRERPPSKDAKGLQPHYDLVVPVDIQDWLEESVIGELGVTFVDVQPSTVELQVAVLQDVTLPISADRLVEDALQLTAPPILDPSEATFQIPRNYLQDINGDPVAPLGMKLQLTQLKKDIIETLDENVPRVLTVPLEPAVDFQDNWWLGYSKISPANINVTITIRKQTDTLELASVPILLVAPWSQLQRYSVVLEDNQHLLTRPISIAGPSDVIEKIRQGQVKVWAELRLTAEDLEKGITSQQVHINIPPNVQIESAIPVVHFSVTAKQPIIPPTSP